jgi:hypothetical protein
MDPLEYSELWIKLVTKYVTNEGFVIGMMYISSLLIYRHFLFLTYLTITQEMTTHL